MFSPFILYNSSCCLGPGFQQTKPSLNFIEYLGSQPPAFWQLPHYHILPLNQEIISAAAPLNQFCSLSISFRGSQNHIVFDRRHRHAPHRRRLKCGQICSCRHLGCHRRPQIRHRQDQTRARSLKATKGNGDIRQLATMLLRVAITDQDFAPERVRVRRHGFYDRPRVDRRDLLW
jgi:hypothetical protein